MSKENSRNPLRETITPDHGSGGQTPIFGVSPNPGGEVRVGNVSLPNPSVSNVLLTQRPSSDSVRVEGPPPPTLLQGPNLLVANHLALALVGRCSPSQMSSQDLTETGAPSDGDCVQSHRASIIAPDGSKDDQSLSSLEALNPINGGVQGPISPRSSDIPLRGVSEDGGGIPGVDAGQVGLLQKSSLGDERSVSPGTPDGPSGLAQASLVNNETGHAVTNRAHVSAEPPRTGEEEEQKVDSDTGGVVGRDVSFGDDGSNKDRLLSGQQQDSACKDSSETPNDSASTETSKKNASGGDQGSKTDNSKRSPSKKDNSKGQGSKKDVPKGSATKPASQSTPKVSKHRDSEAFYKNPGDVNSFLDQILMVPTSQVYELTVKLDESLRGWSDKVICSQFVKENPGSLWGSKFPELLIHKKNPTTMVISCYDLKTCVAMGGTTFKLGGKDYQVPQYTRYGSNYCVTFTKVNNNVMARAIVANLVCLTKSVITAFNPTADQTVASPHLRVIFKTSAPPPQLVPKNEVPLREIVITDPAGNPYTAVFQHKISALNTNLPPSIAALRAVLNKIGKGGSASPNSSKQNTQAQPLETGSMESVVETSPNPVSSSASSDMEVVEEQSTPPVPSVESVDMEVLQDQQVRKDSQQFDTVDMEGNQAHDVVQELIQEVTCDDSPEDVIMAFPNSPAQAPNGEHLQQPALELVLVTGNRSAPATKRALSLSPRGATPLFTSNRYILLQEDDVELSIEDHNVPRLVLEDPEHSRVIIQTKKKQRNEAKKAILIEPKS
ncbi:Aste57867_183 [Aphanomyces stellatus]|uniref:Aste57867_183 protein n=1 Tax=Aphanomyces stellatus TaxID=120398 RepID=A0A485K638_9STRA|nr:hypothetical protein As57867_000183 [Aphanomyces stellatus]VFT77409.1 Aste57867_183 [Aphanomyces stellatus]